MTDKQPNPAQTVLNHIKARADVHETARQAILDALLDAVIFDGWTALSLDQAVRAAGYDRTFGLLAFPDGIGDALDLFAERSDIAMLAAMAKPEFSELKIREKVTQAILARLTSLEPHREAARRAAGTLALPHLAPKGASLIWRTADLIWRGLGDPSTDFNYYSKRATLSAVWSSVFVRWLGDESDEFANTRDFLGDRIDNVMGIEKLKKQWRDLKIDPGKLIADEIIPALAKLRFPSGR